MRLIAIIALLMAGPALVRGQCANGSCAAPARVPYAEPIYWTAADAKGQITLWHNGERVGTFEPLSGQWNTAGKKHWTNLAEAFGLRPIGDPKSEIRNPKSNVRAYAAKPPRCGDDCQCGDDCDGNCECCLFDGSAKIAPNRTLNMGMDWTPDPRGGERCTVNGKATSCRTLFETLGKGGGASDIPDDSTTPRLVMVAKDAGVRDGFLRDFGGSKWSKSWLPHAYDPDNWAMKGLYPATSAATLYAVEGEARGAKLIGRADGYAGPPDLDKYLAAAERLRNPSPDVDPLKAPDLAKPKPAPAPAPGPNQAAGITPNQVGVGLLGALGAFAGLLVLGRRK